jgi:hypothetical protein
MGNQPVVIGLGELHDAIRYPIEALEGDQLVVVQELEYLIII